MGGDDWDLSQQRMACRLFAALQVGTVLDLQVIALGLVVFIVYILSVKKPRRGKLSLMSSISDNEEIYT